MPIWQYSRSCPPRSGRRAHGRTREESHTGRGESACTHTPASTGYSQSIAHTPGSWSTGMCYSWGAIAPAGAVATHPSLWSDKQIFCKKLHLACVVQDRASRVAVPEGAPPLRGLYVEVQLEVVEHTNFKHSSSLGKVSTSQTVVTCRATNGVLSFDTDMDLNGMKRQD